MSELNLCNTLNPNAPFDRLPTMGWSRAAGLLAMGISARRGFAATLLFGRPLNANAAWAVHLHQQAVAYRLKWGIPEHPAKTLDTCADQGEGL